MTNTTVLAAATDGRRLVCDVHTAAMFGGSAGDPDMPIFLIPRPSRVITSVVVATSIMSGLAFGLLIGGVALAVASAKR